MAGSVSLALEIIARDRASRALDDVGDAAERTGRRSRTAGRAIGALATGALGLLAGAVKTGIGEVKDYQTGLADLENVIKTTKGAAGVTADEMESLAGSIASYSGQTDDSIVKAEGLLATFTNIRNGVGKNNDIFSQATALTADMAQKFGGDASGAAVQLGKALNDPVKGVTALSKIGVTFTAEQKKTIASLVKTGDVAGAQKVILAELNKEVGGSARAFGQTIPGQTERAKRAFEDASQSVVMAALPAMTSIADIITTKVVPALTTVTNFLVENKAVVVPVAAAIGTLAAAVWVVNTAVRAYTAVQAALNVVMAANPVMLVVVALAALGVGFVLLWKKSETFRAIVTGTFNAVKGAFTGAWGVIKGGFSWLQNNWPLVLAILTGPIGLAVLTITRNFDSIVGFIKGMPGKITGAAKGMFDGIWQAFKGAINTIIGAWNGLKFKVPGWDPPGPGPKFGGFTIGVPSIPMLADGGVIKRAGLSIVGERGAELLNMPRGASVTPLQGAPVGGGGDTYVTVYVDGNGDPMAQARAIETRLASLQRTRGTKLAFQS